MVDVYICRPELDCQHHGTEVTSKWSLTGHVKCQRSKGSTLGLNWDALDQGNVVSLSHKMFRDDIPNKVEFILQISFIRSMLEFCSLLTG